MTTNDDKNSPIKQKKAFKNLTDDKQVPVLPNISPIIQLENPTVIPLV